MLHCLASSTTEILPISSPFLPPQFLTSYRFLLSNHPLMDRPRRRVSASAAIGSSKVSALGSQELYRQDNSTVPKPLRVERANHAICDVFRHTHLVIADLPIRANHDATVPRA